MRKTLNSDRVYNSNYTTTVDLNEYTNEEREILLMLIKKGKVEEDEEIELR